MNGVVITIEPFKIDDDTVIKPARTAHRR